MDLRSIINSEATDNSASKQVTPITPVQAAAPQQGFREYNNPQLASSTKHPSQDYGLRVSDPYASPTSYQGGYHGRSSAPPPLKPPSQSDLRSPAGSYSAQSPYTRHTPPSSISGGQYPFPQSQTPQSPAQTHPFANSLQHRESYPQSHAPPVQHQHQTSYTQQSPISNTPTSATPSNAHSYFPQQRSHSSHSISTPTSAHSQQQYFNQYTQESPVSATSFPPVQIPQHQRQQSQPQTPLGPPISNSRQASGSFPQPTSPYQQRPPSSGAINQPYASSHTSTPPSLQHQHTRPPSTPSGQGSRQASLADSLPRSQSARERSVSISPKTQVVDLPRTEMTKTHPPPIENGRAQTPKRKMEDREISEPIGTPHTVNGGQLSQPSVTPSPQQPARKRIRYTEPPIWARSVTGRTKNLSNLLNIKRPVNGKQVDRIVKAEPPNGHHQIASVPPKQLSQVAKADAIVAELLSPWEPSITGVRPYEEITKVVADWLFVHVVSRPDAGELASRGVEVEIEAKLGQLIHKDTNERFELPAVTECILSEKARVSFVSSMTEAQHKALNEFLNGKVEETHPGNPNRTQPRVPVVYAHRRERDRFYELPQTAQATLPACIRRELNPRHAVKVRVTHDQKTGQLLAKIIKTRVADLNIYNPRCPLDCRISVNMEMRYDGDVENLVTAAESSRRPDRNKDRLSYTHSHYQIDLTQVTVADPGVRMEKEHELEIEVSAAAVRDQGKRAMAGQPHNYRELVEGLMDNVRVLARAVPDNSAVL